MFFVYVLGKLHCLVMAYVDLEMCLKWRWALDTSMEMITRLDTERDIFLSTIKELELKLKECYETGGGYCNGCMTAGISARPASTPALRAVTPAEGCQVADAAPGAGVARLEEPCAVPRVTLSEDEDTVRFVRTKAQAEALFGRSAGASVIAGNQGRVVARVHGLRAVRTAGWPRSESPAAPGPTSGTVPEAEGSLPGSAGQEVGGAAPVAVHQVTVRSLETVASQPDGVAAQGPPAPKCGDVAVEGKVDAEALLRLVSKSLKRLARPRRRDRVPICWGCKKRLGHQKRQCPTRQERVGIQESQLGLKVPDKDQRCGFTAAETRTYRFGARLLY